MNTTSPILLRVDASARNEGSTTRRLADGVQARWSARHAGGRVQRRDLALDPVPHIAAATIQGFYTPPEQMSVELRRATAQSDALIAELKAAHTVLISAPIYNFSIPSSLKAWIDHVVRIGHTFAYDNGDFRGLVKGPRAVLALAYGAGGYGGALAQMDHLRPYLTSLLSFIGITQIEVIAVEATTADADTVARNVQAAHGDIEALFPQ